MATLWLGKPREKELTFHERLCFLCQDAKSSCQKFSEALDLNPYLVYENVLRLVTYDWSITDLFGYEFACEFNLKTSDFIKDYKEWPILLGFMLVKR